jgi:hypothetical protein
VQRANETPVHLAIRIVGFSLQYRIIAIAKTATRIFFFALAQLPEQAHIEFA